MAGNSQVLYVRLLPMDGVTGTDENGLDRLHRVMQVDHNDETPGGSPSDLYIGVCGFEMPSYQIGGGPMRVLTYSDGSPLSDASITRCPMCFPKMETWESTEERLKEVVDILTTYRSLVRSDCWEEMLVAMLRYVGFHAVRVVYLEHLRLQRVVRVDPSEGTLGARLAEDPVSSGLAVYGQKDRLNEDATRWLDQIVMRIQYASGSKSDALAQLISDSRPIEPILLTTLGERFIQRASPGLHNQHLRDDMELIVCEGVHAICGGTIRFIPVSERFLVLHCDRCGLRIELSREFYRTFGHLRPDKPIQK